MEGRVKISHEEMLKRVLAVASREASEMEMERAVNPHYVPRNSHLGVAVKYFRLGLERRLPDDWAKYEKQARKEADPEYAEFVRLRKKFGV